MIVLCWNCRGLGNPQTVNALKDLVTSYKSNILFLMETKVFSYRMKFFRSFLHFDGCFSVNRQGLGGISLMEKSYGSVFVVSFSLNFIDSIVSEGNI